MKNLHYVPILLLLLLCACERSQETGVKPGEPSADVASPGDWGSIQQQRRDQLEHYLRQEQVAYRWFADSADNDPAMGEDIAVGTGTVTFNGEGNIVGDPNALASIERATVASDSPLEFEFDFSQVSGLAADSASISASRQDGSTAGTLSSFLIGEDGTLRGVFTNGVARTLGLIRLARFANASNAMAVISSTQAGSPSQLKTLLVNESTISPEIQMIAVQAPTPIRIIPLT